MISCIPHELFLVLDSTFQHVLEYREEIFGCSVET